MTVLEHELRTSLAEIAEDCTGRLTDQARLDAGMKATAKQTRFPEVHHWNPLSLSFGDAGLALMCLTMDESRGLERPTAVTHRFIARAAQGLGAGVPSLNLFGGVPGFAGVMALAGTHGDYQDALSRLDTMLGERLTAGLRADGLSYDLISGLAGWGAWLRLRPGARDLRDAVVDAVVDRLDALAGYRGLIRFPSAAPGALPAPFGYLDCGMAHGVAGMLALLALYALDGHPLDARGRRAMSEAAHWLAARAVIDSSGVYWPRVARLDAYGSFIPGPVGPPGWCYGSAGTARAMWLAGRALDDGDHQLIAIRALQTSLNPAQLARLTTPTLCHGLAGLLLITMICAGETGDELLLASADTVARALLRQYDGTSLFGYRDVEIGGGPVDSPGFLSGAAGIVSVLAAASAQQIPGFARLLLLS